MAIYGVTTPLLNYTWLQLLTPLVSRPIGIAADYINNSERGVGVGYRNSRRGERRFLVLVPT